MKKLIAFLICFLGFAWARSQSSPNVILLYADDLGYGDLSCYGATSIHTPNIDQLSRQGIRFTNGHSTSATCTPSRYALMTGRYPWRQEGTEVLPGDASLIIPTNKISLSGLFQMAGYKTGLVGKWHLGLGKQVEKNWNEKITPGPNEVGFDYSFIFPATADRVPTVFLENGYVVGVDKNDSIKVNYNQKVGNEPTGKENPYLLKMHASPNHGHDNTIVNGIGRIGYMTGGIRARWTDEEMPLTFLIKAKEFIEDNQAKPFFLFYSFTEPHVPRMPSTLFKGKSPLGYRGDAILQLDWAVGEIMKHLKNLGIEKNTLIVFTSDNGPVLDDGYADGAAALNKDHRPSGPLRGGKYSAFEGGTRVPFIISWPGTVVPKTSDAMISQVDLFASFAVFLKQPLSAGNAMDSYNLMPSLLGTSNKARPFLISQGQGGRLNIILGKWKYIEPRNGPPVHPKTNIELGNSALAQLYNLDTDIGERTNLAAKYPEKLNELSGLLEKIKQEKTNL